MLTNRFSNIFIVALVLAAALITVSFAVSSAPAPSANWLYESIEQTRNGRSFSGPQADTSYDLIENMRISAGLSADRRYDQIEEFRISPMSATTYDLIENLRVGRTFGSFAADNRYDGIERVRAEQLVSALNTYTFYDVLENLRLLR